MSDDKHKKGQRDRLKVAGGQDYEVAYLAKETGITAQQALELIQLFGNDRDILMDEAQRLKGTRARA